MKEIALERYRVSRDVDPLSLFAEAFVLGDVFGLQEYCELESRAGDDRMQRIAQSEATRLRQIAMASLAGSGMF